MTLSTVVPSFVSTISDRLSPRARVSLVGHNRAIQQDRPPTDFATVSAPVPHDSPGLFAGLVPGRSRDFARTFGPDFYQHIPARISAMCGKWQPLRSLRWYERGLTPAADPPSKNRASPAFSDARSALQHYLSISCQARRTCITSCHNRRSRCQVARSDTPSRSSHTLRWFPASAGRPTPW